MRFALPGYDLRRPPRPVSVNDMCALVGAVVDAVSPDQKVTLTELSSRKTSERNGRVGTREETTTTFRKRYRLVRSRRTAGGPPRDIEMDCVDYQLTAP